MVAVRGGKVFGSGGSKPLPAPSNFSSSHRRVITKFSYRSASSGGAKARADYLARGRDKRDTPEDRNINERAVQFVKAFTISNRPVAAICHGPWTLIEADALRDRRVTSWPSLKTDLRNAGAIWVDGEVIEDRGLITSRKPDDIPAFNQKMIEVFADSIRTRGLSSSLSSK